MPNIFTNFLDMSKILTIIPARLASTRLPNKPLADILGKSMIIRVYEQAKKANLGEVVVAWMEEWGCTMM